MAQWSSGTMLALGYVSAIHVASGPGFEPQLGPILFFLLIFTLVLYAHSTPVLKSTPTLSIRDASVIVRNKCPRYCYATASAQSQICSCTAIRDSRASFPSMVLTVHKDDYKHSKEAFVAGMTGSTVYHVNMIAFVALVCLHHLSLHTVFGNDATTRPLLRYTPPSAHAHHHRNHFCYFRNGYSSLSLCSSR